MFCEGSLVTGDLCELHAVFCLNTSHLQAAPWSGQTLQLQFPAHTTRQYFCLIPKHCF